MFEDKELLNIILYEKRFVTYAVCAVMIIAGVLLGLVKVPDTEVLDEFNKNYALYEYREDEKGIREIRSEKREDGIYVTCDNKNIVGVYFGENYQKCDFEKKSAVKVSVPCEGKITGYVSAKENRKQQCD
ncbi:MAG: hypothetical protein KBT47_01055 [Armatimonadetes bacterium]|nr:hypothetical protein [Candidatus Hippobium faecium]